MLALSGPPSEQGGGFRLDPPQGVKRRKTPILFVHGMTCGGWVFRALGEKLAAQGWEVHCITMYKTRFKTVSMYMDELQVYIQDNLEQGPILIGVRVKATSTPPSCDSRLFDIAVVQVTAWEECWSNTML